MKTNAEFLVLGGGLAGSMVALEIARAGGSVLLLEKTKVPHHKVCGEFLSRESLHYLERHNVNVGALGGVPIRNVKLVGRQFTQECTLPFAALSITRRQLDEELLCLALANGVQVHRGAFVEQCELSEGTWSAQLRTGETFRARSVFLATGKQDMRGRARPTGQHNDLVAFKMYFRLTAQQRAEIGPTVELILFPGGYAGLQPVEKDAVNLCLLINAHTLRQAGSNWAGVMNHILEHSPHLAHRLQGAEALLDAPLAASQIPYGHMQRTSSDGLWRVGDQAAVIPSFCGDGMSIALHSGALAASYCLQGLSADAYQRKLHTQLAGRLWLATKLSQLLVARPQAGKLVRAFPALLPGIASLTRIPDRALVPSVALRAAASNA